jgi:hypothetical protein
MASHVVTIAKWHCMCSPPYRRGFIYWSDAISDQMYRSNLDGTSIMFLANATHEDIGEIRIKCL